MGIEERFDSLTLKDFDEFVARGQEEHLQLEFKLVNSPDFNQKDDRKNLAIALSGFANSSGGLIIWGIDSRKGGDGVDHASEKKEIAELSTFISRLNSLTGEAVSPMVDGVRHRFLPTTGDKGFAVTIVPESISGPHMAKLGEDRYYKRSGDSFRKMEHFDLEDMFGRRKRPKLSLRVKPVSFHKSDRFYIRLLLSIENIGRGTARAPYLSVNKPINCLWSESGVDGHRHFGLPPVIQNTGRDSYGANSDFVIHPGVVHDVTVMDFYFPREDSFDDLVIPYRVAAEDMQMTEACAVVSGEELHSFFQARRS